MGRVKEFNDQEALEKAKAVFWEKGYENASLKELLAEMGILNGSFYNTYGSKKKLYIEALNLYLVDFEQKRTALFNSPKLSLKKKMRIMFAHVFDRQKEAICPKGCFLFNSVSADSLKELEIYKIVRSGIEQFEDFLEVEIRKGVKSGEVDNSVDPKLIASVLIAYMQGMMKLSVMDYSDGKFREQTEYLLNSLGV
jgi:TetR/AcrR family transcriptional regulator, transcriptional repressor for nem operon